MPAAEQPAAKPTLVMCGGCGADRLPDQPTCMSPECVRQREREKVPSWASPDFRQRNFRTRGVRRR